jgi:GrpB-like predicted nucleotidyltransferase (UPF0157 family)
MAIEVVEYSPNWPIAFEAVAATLRDALVGVPVVSIEHVGSTAVPGLAAKPILDIDVIVTAEHLPAAIAALATIGYEHRGDLGVTGREALTSPDLIPRRHVYVCADGTLHVRNHLAVRRVLRERPGLRDRYAEVKRQLASIPDIDMERYLAGKSAILQEVLSHSGLTTDEKAEILRLNTGQ